MMQKMSNENRQTQNIPLQMLRYSNLQAKKKYNDAFYQIHGANILLRLVFFSPFNVRSKVSFGAVGLPITFRGFAQRGIYDSNVSHKTKISEQLGDF
jgi:hypothetical protein